MKPTFKVSVEDFLSQAGNAPGKCFQRAKRPGGALLLYHGHSLGWITDSNNLAWCIGSRLLDKPKAKGAEFDSYFGIRPYLQFVKRNPQKRSEAEIHFFIESKAKRVKDIRHYLTQTHPSILAEGPEYSTDTAEFLKEHFPTVWRSMEQYLKVVWAPLWIKIGGY
ncbi:hypothetical protein [Pseudodesulfovibrio indicus]|uniref:hypothetical protein n=1 Tax=Pseudodesulfovibrio indicus TaxID=1716143 RepID=UPI002930D509|nr:hypothetical protein [Pseudodesulfovibrio indicus]